MNYFIHYQGWNAKWDKWVEESAISKAIADKNENVILNYKSFAKIIFFHFHILL